MSEETPSVMFNRDKQNRQTQGTCSNNSNYDTDISPINPNNGTSLLRTAPVLLASSVSLGVSTSDPSSSFHSRSSVSLSPFSFLEEPDFHIGIDVENEMLPGLSKINSHLKEHIDAEEKDASSDTAAGGTSSSESSKPLTAVQRAVQAINARSSSSSSYISASNSASSGTLKNCVPGKQSPSREGNSLKKRNEGHQRIDSLSLSTTYAAAIPSSPLQPRQQTSLKPKSKLPISINRISPLHVRKLETEPVTLYNRHQHSNTVSPRPRALYDDSNWADQKIVPTQGQEKDASSDENDENFNVVNTVGAKRETLLLEKTNTCVAVINKQSEIKRSPQQSVTIVATEGTDISPFKSTHLGKQYDAMYKDLFSLHVSPRVARGNQFLASATGEERATGKQAAVVQQPTSLSDLLKTVDAETWGEDDYKQLSDMFEGLLIALNKKLESPPPKAVAIACTAAAVATTATTATDFENSESINGGCSISNKAAAKQIVHTPCKKTEDSRTNLAAGNLINDVTFSNNIHWITGTARCAEASPSSPLCCIMPTSTTALTTTRSPHELAPGHDTPSVIRDDDNHHDVFDCVGLDWVGSPTLSFSLSIGSPLAATAKSKPSLESRGHQMNHADLLNQSSFYMREKHSFISDDNDNDDDDEGERAKEQGLSDSGYDVSRSLDGCDKVAWGGQQNLVQYFEHIIYRSSPDTADNSHTKSERIRNESQEQQQEKNTRPMEMSCCKKYHNNLMTIGDDVLPVNVLCSSPKKCILCKLHNNNNNYYCSNNSNSNNNYNNPSALLQCGTSSFAPVDNGIDIETEVSFSIPSSSSVSTAAWQTAVGSTTNQHHPTTSTSTSTSSPQQTTAGVWWRVMWRFLRRLALFTAFLIALPFIHGVVSVSYKRFNRWQTQREALLHNNQAQQLQQLQHPLLSLQRPMNIGSAVTAAERSREEELIRLRKWKNVHPHMNGKSRWRQYTQSTQQLRPASSMPSSSATTATTTTTSNSILPPPLLFSATFLQNACTNFCWNTEAYFYYSVSVDEDSSNIQKDSVGNRQGCDLISTLVDGDTIIPAICDTDTNTGAALATAGTAAGIRGVTLSSVLSITNEFLRDVGHKVLRGIVRAVTLMPKEHADLLFGEVCK